MMYKILIVTAKKQLRSKLNEYLATAGYEVVEAGNKEEALKLIVLVKPNLTLVDSSVVSVDVLKFCSQLRNELDTALILMIDKGERILGIQGLEEGNDDFLNKPLHRRELLARVKAVLRRVPNVKQTPAREILSFDNLSIWPTQQKVVAFGREIVLTVKEYEILWLLAANPNQVFSRAQLFEQIWGKMPKQDMRTVDTHVKKLRQKLNIVGDSQWSIATVWGVGYKFALEQEFDNNYMI